jgi:hypothetical protein
LTIENSGNLLQTNNVANTGSGSTIVKRNSNPLIRLDYTLWSSPVSGQGLYAFSPFTSVVPNIRFYKYNPIITSPATTGVYSNDLGFTLSGLDGNNVNGTDSSNIPFATGKGYLIRLPWNHPTAAVIWNGQFTGVPNNGTQNVSIINQGDRYNAVGNPYPSPISISQFASDNSNNIIIKTNNIKPSRHFFNFIMVYFIYNNFDQQLGAESRTGKQNNITDSRAQMIHLMFVCVFLLCTIYP